jgi:hypothetical protein
LNIISVLRLRVPSTLETSKEMRAREKARGRHRDGDRAEGICGLCERARAAAAGGQGGDFQLAPRESPRVGRDEGLNVI